MLVFRNDGIAALASFGALMLFSIGGPVLVLLGRSFWLGTLAVVVSWLGLFLGIGMVTELVPGSHLGENAMVLLLPMMVFPGLLALVGCVRLFLWLKARASSAPST
jgi:hypothetical protein